MLCNLPAEVLDLILSRIASYLVINLWKCGNRQLNTKMAQGGCTQVQLTDLSLASTSRWPLLINELKHLYSLRLTSCTPLGQIEYLRKRLSALPRTLECLELEFSIPRQLMSMLLGGADPIEPTPLDQADPYPQENRSVIDKEASNDGNSVGIANLDDWRLQFLGFDAVRPWRLDLLFPRLSTLTLVATMPVLDFATLPRSLRALSLPKFAPTPIFSESMDKYITKMMRDLPEDLTCLNLSRQFMFSTWFPPELRSLTLGEANASNPSNSAYIKRECYQYLPSTLTAANLHAQQESDFLALQHLTSLRHLTITLHDERHVMLLPKLLTSLQVVRCYAPIKDFIAFLPQNLRSLLCYYSPYDKLFHLPALSTHPLPPSLTQLDATDVPTDLIKLLPRSLRTLRLSTEHAWSSDGITDLPPLLESLEIRVVRDIVPKKVPGPLPHPSKSQKAADHGLQVYVFDLPNTCLTKLHLEVLVMDLRRPNLQWIDFPDCITDLSLYLDLVRACPDLPIVSAFPKHLRRLKLETGRRPPLWPILAGQIAALPLESLDVLGQIISQGLSEDVFRRLPRSLTSLSVKMAVDAFFGLEKRQNSVWFDGNLGDALPPQLSTLILPEDLHFPDRVLAELPQSLTELTIHVRTFTWASLMPLNPAISILRVLPHPGIAGTLKDAGSYRDFFNSHPRLSCFSCNNYRVFDDLWQAWTLDESRFLRRPDERLDSQDSAST